VSSSHKKLEEINEAPRDSLIPSRLNMLQKFHKVHPYPPMSTRRLRIATPGMIAAAAAIGATTLTVIAPVDLLSLSLQSNRAFAQDVDEQINIRVYQRASPAVVSIDTNDGAGSGSIISPDGLVLTNAHVVDNAPTVEVTLTDGRKFLADVVGFGANGLDLAVVKIRGANNLPTITLAGSAVQVGQRAFAIGNPFGRFQGTFTTGIVSRIDQERGLIQTDAAINPGNSGGPLLNSQGELIGVNTAIFTDSRRGGNIGIGFAIALERVQPFLAAVRSGSLITARLGLEAGREIFAVPGSPLDARCRGSNDLIRQGAHLTETVEDVLAHLPQAPEAEPAFRYRPTARSMPETANRALASHEATGEETQVLDLLGPAPIAVDDVLRRCQLSTPVVQAILLDLELSGRVEMLPGHRVALTGKG